MYVIVNKEDPTLTWTNADGWGDGYDVFSQGEKDTLDLPIGGEWQLAPPPQFTPDGEVPIQAMSRRERLRNLLMSAVRAIEDPTSFENDAELHAIVASLREEAERMS